MPFASLFAGKNDQKHPAAAWQRGEIVYGGGRRFSAPPVLVVYGGFLLSGCLVTTRNSGRFFCPVSAGRRGRVRPGKAKPVVRSLCVCDFRRSGLVSRFSVKDELFHGFRQRYSAPRYNAPEAGQPEGAWMVGCERKPLFSRPKEGRASASWRWAGGNPFRRNILVAPAGSAGPFRLPEQAAIPAIPVLQPCLKARRDGLRNPSAGYADPRRRIWRKKDWRRPLPDGPLLSPPL